MFDGGTLLAFSSDVVTFCELNRADPFFGMQVASTRVEPQLPLDPENYPVSTRPPESAKLALSVQMKGYTVSAAKQPRWDDRLGSLQPGKLANLCVRSANPFAVEPFQLKSIKFEPVTFEGTVISGGWGRINGCGDNSSAG